MTLLCLGIKQILEGWKIIGSGASVRRLMQMMGFSHRLSASAKQLNQVPVLGECSRECLALEVSYSMTAQDVAATLQRFVAQRGAPAVYPL